MLDAGEWGPWSREFPKPGDPDKAAKLFPAPAIFLKRLSPTTLWLRIPDFLDERAKDLRDLIAAHEGELETTPNLIIDERNNGGGSDYVYDPLVPLLYTQPIVEIGAEMRATADNIALRHERAQQIKPSAPDQAAKLEEQNARMQAHLGSYVQQYDRPFSVDRREKVLRYPRHIVVLVDGAGSTGEQFLLLARQSRKVTLMGQRNSAGVLDFANVVSMPAPSDRFNLQWATSRSLRLPDDPVDPDGIAPDIRIPKSVDDPVTYAAKWLERQVD